MSDSGIKVHIAKESSVKASDSAVIEAPSIGLNGAVKIARLVVGHIQAESYSTGPLQELYKLAEHNLEDGSGKSGGNSPDNGGRDGSNRHCTAHEEFKQCIDLICDMLQCCCNFCGCPDTTDQVRSLAAQAIMRKNRGE